MGRFSCIQDIICPSCWSHVSGVHNPADHGYCGLLDAQFVENDLWFYGPHWLSLKEEDWPRSYVITGEENNEIGHEKKKSINKLIRGLKRLLIFFKGSVPKLDGALSLDELEIAIECIVRHDEEIYFDNQFKKLSKDDLLSKKDSLASLYTVWDTHDKLIRVGGCLKNIAISPSYTRRPIRIACKCIAPRAPHRGCAWETMVKITKNVLRRQFGNVHMTVKQLNIALIEIEAVLISRRLVPLSPDASEDTITPSMLITVSSARREGRLLFLKSLTGKNIEHTMEEDKKKLAPASSGGFVPATVGTVTPTKNEVKKQEPEAELDYDMRFRLFD
ncbi:unnamed protein product [Lepeophtheirus salmonis]|uniref:(salmon louse) hypothetical protein n=1 Tax=Lepeophtheirus salmonis TaxID=72036 RepID=A0A7R8D2R4_LEPSM|nr:unnamed protein product [Lepeophtheirus salmonis]CAF3008239.1 unnamed protein product [Lepeophtheirus salmonis]